METPSWYSVNIWNLLWLSRRRVIGTEHASIYVSPFSKNQTSKKARNHDISIYVSNKPDRRLVSRTFIALNFKMLWFPNEGRYWAVKLLTDINILSLMHDEDKTFGGSLVWDFRKRWGYVKTIYCVFLALSIKRKFASVLEIVSNTACFQLVFLGF